MPLASLTPVISDPPRSIAGYEEPAPVDSAAFWIYRLDAAVMLALLFNAEASLAELGPRAVDRLREVHQRLSRGRSR
jgi:hypothetical protein